MEKMVRIGSALAKDRTKALVVAGQKIGGYRIGSNQIAGTINISRIAKHTFSRLNQVVKVFRKMMFLNCLKTS